MIIQLSLTFVVFFIIRFALGNAKRVSLTPLYLLLLARLSYPGVIYSSFSLGLLEMETSPQLAGLFRLVWLIGMIVVSAATLFGMLEWSRPQAPIEYHDNIPPQVRGFLRPTIILPKSKTADNDLILLHEMQHIQRKHHWIKLLFQVYCVVFWWHPFIWLTRRLLHHDLELDCDEAVLKNLSLQERRRYAHCIIDHATMRVSLNNSLGGPPMKKRITAIINQRRQPLALSLLIALGLSLLSLPLLSAPINALSLANQPPLASTGEIVNQKPIFERPHADSLLQRDRERSDEELIALEAKYRAEIEAAEAKLHEEIERIRAEALELEAAEDMSQIEHP